MNKRFILLAAAGIALSMAAQEHLKSLNKEDLSPEISPKTDFYHHVNQKWMDANPLTPEYSRYGRFDALTDTTVNRVKGLFDKISKGNPDKNSVAYKISVLYNGGMDSVRLNSEGAKPILADLAKIENAKPSEMEDILVWMHRNISSPLFNIGPMEDFRNSNEYAMYLTGVRLGLGDRDYYLLNDKENKKVRDAYVKLIKTQMQNAGYSKKDAERIAKNVLKVETLLADSVWTREESRNLQAMNNLFTYAEAKSMYPDLPIDRLMAEALKISAPENIYVTEINTVKQADNLMKSLTDREKKDYYLWEYVSQASPYLSDKFIDTNFEFNKVMTGAQQQRPRWKRVQSLAENMLGEAVGELYVEEYFPESSKVYMEGLVENLRNALGKHIMHLPWMSDDTKLQALKKLNSINVKIGYPDNWEDYSAMVIDPALSYYENVQNARMWHQDKELSKWGKPVDRAKWGMTPQTVNAYYNPLYNEIVFPAAILQAPFYDPASSDAENYGGIGVVIGHELTHGFDDQGSVFDAQGNMQNWWTPEDAEAFQNLTQGLARQFDAVEVLPGLYANGQYTLGENIADQGGLRIAMTAFLDSQKKKGVDVTSEEALIDGIDPMQVFYLNYANLWGQNVRPEEVRRRTTSDVHSLGENRVNVTLRNIQPFFEAFEISDGDAMYLPVEERVIIW